MGNSEVILSVQNLKKYFPMKSGVVFSRVTGQVKAVDDVSFQVKKGQTLGIVGESGCGKSTMGKTIARLLPSTAGQVIFKGEEISKYSDKKMIATRRLLQFIFQNPYASLNPRMTIGSILTEPLKIHKIAAGSNQQEIVINLLKTVGLAERHYDYYPHEFSGGQRQRIAIARAIVTKPELVIADEAVSALDVSVQAQILNLMQDLQDQYGLTYIFISHDLSVIEHISNQIIVMYLGKMMEFADKEALFKAPLHPYTQGLLAAAPSLDQHKPKNHKLILDNDLPSASNPPSGCVFHTRCPYCKDICKEALPEIREMEAGHYVACHFAGEAGNAGAYVI